MKTVLFLHGAGEGAYEADKILADSLAENLGEDYSVIYPQLPNEEDAPYDLWKDQIVNLANSVDGDLILVGHSVGASHLIKILSEVELDANLKKTYLLAPPFWGGKGWTYEGYEEIELKKDRIDKLSNVQIEIFACAEDEIVPAEHTKLYKEILPTVGTKILPQGNHQFNNDLTFLSEIIRKD